MRIKPKLFSAALDAGRLQPAMWLAVILLCFEASCVYSSGAKHPARDGAESLTLTLEHAIGSAREFTERGVASVRSLKSSTTTMSFSQNLLSHIQLEELRMAAASGEVYRLRAPSRLREGLSETDENTLSSVQYVSTTISACSLIKAHLSDVIKIAGDGRGNVIGLALTTQMSASATVDCSSPDVYLPRSFNTSITLDNGSPPPVPDVHSYLQKEEKEEREKKEGKDDRSFFQKYWVYIIIGVFIVMTLNSAGQAAGGGGGGGSGG